MIILAKNSSKNLSKVLRFTMLLICQLFWVTSWCNGQAEEYPIHEALNTLDKAIEFYHSLANNGGYVYSYSVDRMKKWGEGETGDSAIEVQMPGTPGIGNSYLLAFKTTGSKKYLEYAIETSNALIKGQNSYGGWDHKIYFDSKKREEVVSFDDNHTQGTIEFLMELDKYVDIPILDSSINRALKLILTAQFENGAWPHLFPRQGNYHDYATFNDNGINDCVDVMIGAYKQYQREEFLTSIKKAGNFIYISQLSPPQTGWAQQYNEFLQPAWARSFEPASVTPVITISNVNTLMDISLITKDEELLFPVRDAFNWVKNTRLPNGKYPRFVEIGTGKPLYYDRGRKRVSSIDELSEERRTQYLYEQDLSDPLMNAENRFFEITKLGIDKYLIYKERRPSKDEIIDSIKAVGKRVREIISSQDSLGRWVTTKERYKNVDEDGTWTGGYTEADRINSKVFVNNVELICKYISMVNSIKEIE